MEAGRILRTERYFAMRMAIIKSNDRFRNDLDTEKVVFSRTRVSA